MTRLQVGEDLSRPANLIVSTLSEAEFILPLLEEYKKKGREVNVCIDIWEEEGSLFLWLQG